MQGSSEVPCNSKAMLNSTLRTLGKVGCDGNVFNSHVQILLIRHPGSPAKSAYRPNQAFTVSSDAHPTSQSASTDHAFRGVTCSSHPSGLQPKACFVEALCTGIRHYQAERGRECRVRMVNTR